MGERDKEKNKQWKGIRRGEWRGRTRRRGNGRSGEKKGRPDSEPSSENIYKGKGKLTRSAATHHGRLSREWRRGADWVTAIPRPPALSVLPLPATTSCEEEWVFITSIWGKVSWTWGGEYKHSFNSLDSLFTIWFGNGIYTCFESFIGSGTYSKRFNELCKHVSAISYRI